MKKVLVFGGTRYFGKRLVENLIKEGHEVTVATRGKVEDSFGDTIKRVIVDRESREELEKAFKDSEYDIIFDNICYSPNSAQITCDIFNDKIEKYIFTSTMSVYDYGVCMKEENVNTHNYEIKYGEKEDFDYGEGKRQAEAVFFQKGKFQVVAVRFPFVIGEDDYTKRLYFYPENVTKEREFVADNLKGRMSAIYSGEAAEFLEWCAFNQYEGPINCCNNGDMIIGDVIEISERISGKKAKLMSKEECENISPFNPVDKFCIDNSKAKELGFKFRDINDVLEQIIKHDVEKSL